MDLKGTTLGKALRMRSSIANKIATASNRAKNFAVTLDCDPKPDFDVEEQIKDFRKEQTALRSLKIQTSKKSLSTTVLIPEDMPVAEAGQEVSVMQAVLIRDDLKSEKALLDSIVSTPVTFNRYDYEGLAKEERPVKVRNFNFEEKVPYVEQLQEAIDTLDGIIQGTDAVTKFE